LGRDAWSQRQVPDELRWYVFDDRQMYRPGEEVHIKGWLRRIGGKQDGDVGLVGERGQQRAATRCLTARQRAGQRQADVNALGGFDFVFAIPEKPTWAMPRSTCPPRAT
jgi:alpha-2-macroglobulin